MKIVKFKADTKNVRSLTIPEKYITESELLDYNSLPKTNLWPQNWEDLPFYIYNPQNKEHDFWSNSDFLNFNRRALDACFTPFERSGEILTVKVQDHEDLYFLNCLNVCNALDKEKSKINLVDKITKKYLHEPVLIKDRLDLDMPIFFVPGVYGWFFCIVDELERDENFYHLYHDNNLTGLLFEEVSLV